MNDYILERGVWYPIELITFQNGDLDILEQIILMDKEHDIYYMAKLMPQKYGDVLIVSDRYGEKTLPELKKHIDYFMRLPPRNYKGHVDVLD